MWVSSPQVPLYIIEEEAEMYLAPLPPPLQDWVPAEMLGNNGTDRLLTPDGVGKAARSAS